MIMLDDGTVVDFVTFDDSPGETEGAVTLDVSLGEGAKGVFALSSVGVNEAFEADLFFNSEIGTGTPATVTLIGSPGQVSTALLPGD